MRRGRGLGVVAALALCTAVPAAGQGTIHEVTSPYHHIRVVDEGGMRVMYFDDDPQSRMSLENPLQGHFEYVEYMLLPWLWNEDIRKALVIGLGGGSIQRLYGAMHPETRVVTAELDPKVVDVAEAYFDVRDSDGLRIVIEDGRIHLKRSPERYDLVVVDAYTRSRYGGGIPYSLVTREFFELVASRLTENGVLAFNVLGGMEAGRDSVLSRIYRTLQTCFPRLYLFPAASSDNVVVMATMSSTPLDARELQERARLADTGYSTLPVLVDRTARLSPEPPPGTAASRILTDSRAPANGLLETRYAGGWIPRESLGASGERGRGP